MGSHIFGFLGVRQFFIFTVSKSTRIFVTADEMVKCCSFNQEPIKFDGLLVQSKTEMGQFIKMESD